MTTLDLMAWPMFITAGFSYLNHSFLKFPTRLGGMAMARALPILMQGLTMGRLGRRGLKD